MRCLVLISFILVMAGLAAEAQVSQTATTSETTLVNAPTASSTEFVATNKFSGDFRYRH